MTCADDGRDAELASQDRGVTQRSSELREDACQHREDRVVGGARVRTHEDVAGFDPGNGVGSVAAHDDSSRRSTGDDGNADHRRLAVDLERTGRIGTGSVAAML